MFSHVMVGTNDIERARKFYNALLGVMGTGEGQDSVAPNGRKRLLYLGKGPLFAVVEPINGEAATYANGGTIGFACDSPEQVAAFHDAGVAAGATSIEEAPGPRDMQGMGVIHLAYLRDPDGNKLCAMHMPMSA